MQVLSRNKKRQMSTNVSSIYHQLADDKLYKRMYLYSIHYICLTQGNALIIEHKDLLHYLGDVPQTDLLVYNSVSIAGSVNTKSARRV